MPTTMTQTREIKGDVVFLRIVRFAGSTPPCAEFEWRDYFARPLGRTFCLNEESLIGRIGNVKKHNGDHQEEDAALKSLRAAMSENRTDLSKCPSCGGPADNGHSREDPPAPYYCSKCFDH